MMWYPFLTILIKRSHVTQIGFGISFILHLTIPTYDLDLFGCLIITFQREEIIHPGLTDIGDVSTLVAGAVSVEGVRLLHPEAVAAALTGEFLIAFSTFRSELLHTLDDLIPRVIVVTSHVNLPR